MVFRQPEGPVQSDANVASLAHRPSAAKSDFAQLAFMLSFEKFEPHAVGPASTWV
jgi:hypothetical protein